MLNFSIRNQLKIIVCNGDKSINVASLFYLKFSVQASWVNFVGCLITIYNIEQSKIPVRKTNNIGIPFRTPFEKSSELRFLTSLIYYI